MGQISVENSEQPGSSLSGNQHARTLRSQLRGIRAFAGNHLGVCNLATVPSVTVPFLPEALLRLRRTMSSFDVQIREADSRSVTDAVASGAVEIGLASLSEAPIGLDLAPILRDRLDVICRADDPLARRKLPLSWSAIGVRTFLVNESHGTLSDPAFGPSNTPRACISAMWARCSPWRARAWG